MMHTLSVELFGLPLALADFPVLKSIRGLGLSDNRECATVLAEKFDYRNTFYHQEPRLDISRAGSEEHGAYDFVLAGEIFEHVPPPIHDSLSNVRSLLKPSGFLVLTVPYSTEATTQEHFPMMKDYRVVSVGDQLALLNRTEAGEWQVFDNLVFHGGDGSTVEMRLFSEASLTDALSAAGFRRIQYMTDEHPGFGIVHEGLGVFRSWRAISRFDFGVRALRNYWSSTWHGRNKTAKNWKGRRTSACVSKAYAGS